jgi:hypothetical protein
VYAYSPAPEADDLLRRPVRWAGESTSKEIDMTEATKIDGKETRDELQLEVEEVADLEISEADAADVLGASSIHPVADQIGRQNC